MQTKDALTLMLPLVSRDYATERILSQMSSDNVKFKILLADGSGMDKSDKFSNTKYPKLNLEYVNFGEDKTVHHWMTKMYNAIKTIETPFTVLVDNDDLVSKEGMSYGVEFLMQNDDYVSFRGALPCTGGSVSGPWYLPVMKNHHTSSESIVNDTVFDRVSIDLSKKDSAWGDITKTHAMEKLYKILSLSETQDVMLTFTIDSGIRLFYGKNKKDFSLPLCYHIPGDTLILNREDWLGYKRWSEFPGINQSLGLYVSTVATAMHKIDGVPLNKAKEQFAEFLIEDMLQSGVCWKMIGDVDGEIRKSLLISGAVEASNNYDQLSDEIIV